MIRMGNVWDSTVAVLAGRGGLVARIALLTFFLPAVMRDLVPLALGAGTATRVVLVAMWLVVAAVALLGRLALTAVASDPAADERAAFRRAGEVFPQAFGTMLLLVAVLALLALPGVVLLIRSGFDARAAMIDAPQPRLLPAAFLAASLYLLALALSVLWAVARLLPIHAVFVNERLGFGMGVIRRSLALTRGLTWRILGVLILYAIVSWVAVVAVRSVIGLAFRFALGPDRATLVVFLAGVAVALVTTLFGMLQPVFAARLYAAVRETREGAAPPA